MSNRTSVGSIGKAGWGQTLGAAVVSVIYFFPMLYIILTAFKTRQDALDKAVAVAIAHSENEESP